MGSQDDHVRQAVRALHEEFGDDRAISVILDFTSFAYLIERVSPVMSQRKRKSQIWQITLEANSEPFISGPNCSFSNRNIVF